MAKVNKRRAALREDNRPTSNHQPLTGLTTAMQFASNVMTKETAACWGRYL